MTRPADEGEGDPLQPVKRPRLLLSARRQDTHSDVPPSDATEEEFFKSFGAYSAYVRFKLDISKGPVVRSMFHSHLSNVPDCPPPMPEAAADMGLLTDIIREPPMGLPPSFEPVPVKKLRAAFTLQAGTMALPQSAAKAEQLAGAGHVKKEKKSKKEKKEKKDKKKKDKKDKKEKKSKKKDNDRSSV